MEENRLSALDTEEESAGVVLRSIHKTWVNKWAAFKAVGIDFLTALQLSLIVFLYAFFAYFFDIFFYISLALTVLTAAYVCTCEHDGQIKASWMMLLIASCGCGYIIYLLALKPVCYGYDRRRFEAISERTKKYFGDFSVENASVAVMNDCEYIYNAGGFVPYNGTDAKYFHDARPLFNDMLERIESAKHFVLMEFFILADSVLLNRFIDVFKRKIAQGVEVKLLCDDVGCAGVLSDRAKKRIKESGVQFKFFQKLLAPFTFGMNFRDHRKIVVIDGETGYVGGVNVSDQYTNEYEMDGYWKDCGLRLDGAAVDALSVTFLRQWELATREKIDYENYVNKFTVTENNSHFVPYAGGPEIKADLCRGVYLNVISGAREKLYVMTPYFIPDGGLYALIKAKAQSGVDVRLVLPSVPDYPFIYRVTRSNAEKLIKYGVKVYYVPKTFVHSKVMLTENCVTVGSVNMDMRAFYQEFDNGVYTDDKSVMAEVAEDFEGTFTSCNPATESKYSFFGSIITGILKIVSPLM